MTLQPIPVENFGGLNLVDDPGTVGWNQAIDCLNVDIWPGRVTSRNGFIATGASGVAAAAVDSIFPVTTTGTDYFLVGTTTPTLQVFGAGLANVETVNRVGGGTGTTQTASAAVHNFVKFGDTTNEYVYIANGTDQVRRFKPSTLTFSAPAGLAAYTGNLVAITPWDNRLVVNDTTNKSRIWFSDAGAPETIGANNFVNLTPGDGEAITAICVWRDLLFVFKPSRFFVFYGTETDSSGNPIFKYRTVDTGIGIPTPSNYAQRAAKAGPDALYFAGRTGIYKTTGDAPQSISDAIEPAFTGWQLSPLFASLWWSASEPVLSTANTDPLALDWYEGRLYFAFSHPSFSPYLSHAFVWDPKTSYWTVWTLPGTARALTHGELPGGEPGFLLTASSTALLRQATVATDNGSAITSSYRSGFSDIGTPNMKRIHSWRLQGSGAPTLKVSSDFGALETGAAVTLGTAPAVAEATRRYAPRGRQFSWQLGATTAWSVNSVVGNLAGVRKGAEHAAA